MSAARHARRHRRGRRRASAARTGLLAQATAGVALAAAITAVSSEAAPPALVGKEARPPWRCPAPTYNLAASSSPLNVPINLLIDLINVPYNEVEANKCGRSAGLRRAVVGHRRFQHLGIDLADYARFYALASAAVPIPAPVRIRRRHVHRQRHRSAVREVPGGRDARRPRVRRERLLPNTPVSPDHRDAGPTRTSGTS